MPGVAGVRNIAGMIAFTSFMDEVTLRPVEEHYQHLIALAGSVRRRPGRA